jgi:iron complex outermembrane receptor protein
MRKILLGTTAIATLVISPAIKAQESASSNSSGADAPGETAGAAADDVADQGGLDQIVVTAQRREENLQRAAIAVSAVTGDALVAAGISDTASLTRLVPSLQVAPTGGSSTSFYVRGVGTLQGNAFGENPIAFNYGGVYVARPSAPVGTFYDVERIEVVKGPQGTLYGRNATGGAINVIPNRPRLNQVGGDITLEAGNYNTLKASGAINLPIGDSVAIRFAGQVVDRDGYLSDGYSDEVGQAARASLLFQPEGDWSVLLVADYFHQGGRGVGGVLLPGSKVGNPSSFLNFPGYAAPPVEELIGGADPRSIAAFSAFAATQFAPPPCGGFGGFVTSGCVVPPQLDGYNDSTFYGLSATIEGDIAGLGTLTVIPAYRRSEPDYRFYMTGFRGEAQESVDQHSLEVRLASDSNDRLAYVLGAYYFKETQDAANRFVQGRISDTRFQPQLETKSQAIFGQFTFNVTDGFRLVAGGRYTQEDKSLEADVQLFGLAPTPTTASVSSDLDFSKFTWKAGLEFDLGPQSLLYANVSTGFKAGGFFVGTVDNTFLPELLTAYTVGSKNRFLDNRLQLNFEAFYWKYEDQQISFVGPVQLFPNVFTAGGKTVNAGNGEFYGVEAELQFAVTPDGTFSANVLYNHTTYNSLEYVAISAGGGPLRNGCPVAEVTQQGVLPPARLFNVNCAGRSALNAPRWSATVSYEHNFELGDGHNLVLGARSRLSSSYFTDLSYLPEQEQDAYMQSDAFITLQGPDNNWSLTGFVNNIEDKRVLTYSVVRPVLQAVYGVFAPPRTYGLRASVNF